jgi:hypothetical protein
MMLIIINFEHQTKIYKICEIQCIYLKNKKSIIYSMYRIQQQHIPNLQPPIQTILIYQNHLQK